MKKKMEKKKLKSLKIFLKKKGDATCSATAGASNDNRFFFFLRGKKTGRKPLEFEKGKTHTADMLQGGKEDEVVFYRIIPKMEFKKEKRPEGIKTQKC
ncbi:Uncharacterized protein APZ42_002999 [Daphnia magna]|uniref:Uncharacterized protein n=1 Tax=Daphnia magna TaxID=35525 RepID=A0A164HWL3_9CRUS|nr:Uncharacterized protein APZ42_002999 [Daphnia magna]